MFERLGSLAERISYRYGGRGCTRGKMPAIHQHYSPVILFGGSAGGGSFGGGARYLPRYSFTVPRSSSDASIPFVTILSMMELHFSVVCRCLIQTFVL